MVHNLICARVIAVIRLINKELWTWEEIMESVQIRSGALLLSFKKNEAIILVSHWKKFWKKYSLPQKVSLLIQTLNQVFFYIL